MTPEAGPGPNAPPPRIPRSIEDLDEPKIAADRAVRVRGARVLFADYDSLRRDFPWLGTERLLESHGERARTADPDRREELARELVDRWLLDSAALVSATQAGQTIVNTPIPVTGDAFPVYRLPHGGRAFVVDLAVLGTCGDGEPGLLDVKGIGVAPGVTPARGAHTHTDGLLPVHKALEGLFNKELLDAALDHAGAPYRCLAHYALLDLGFDLLRPDGSRFPAGALVRRANRRPRNGLDAPHYGSPEHRLHLEIELLLRRYGITSATPGTHYVLSRSPDGTCRLLFVGQDVTGGRQEPVRRLWERFKDYQGTPPGAVTFEGINVQVTRPMEGGPIELVDMGQYFVKDRFSQILLSQVCDREAHWGGVIRPDSPHYVQPDPSLALPIRYWQERKLSRQEMEELGCRPGEEPVTGREHGGTYLMSPVQQVCLQLTRDFRGGRVTSAELRRTILRLAHRATSHLHDPPHRCDTLPA